MFASVRFPRLLAAVAVGGLLCAGIGFSAISDIGHAQAPDATEAPPASAAETQAALQNIQAAARADQAADQQRVSKTLPLATELESEAHAMREHLKKMRKLAIQYHLSEGLAESKSLRNQWIAMIETGRKIHERMVSAAMKDYRADPDPRSETAEFLFQIAARNADADRFDGMLEVVKLLKETGYTTGMFDLCFGLTAAAHNEFEAARPHLEIARSNIEKTAQELNQKAEVPDEERQTLLKKMSDTHGLLSELMDVEYYNRLWEAEQKAREEDASGEPLPRVRIETVKGSFELELFEDQAPNTVANFISLCEQNFYDGLPFHRVITHFMAQGGCPNRDGSGGPGYTIRTELGDDHRKFFRGTIGMALAGQPDSGGSQFFICYLPRAFLNGNYVAFGRVVEGMNVLSDITHVDPDDKSESDHSKPPLDEIISTKVVRKRNHPYEPDKISQSK